MSAECTVALSGRHQFNPKKIRANVDGPVKTEYRCVCGQFGSDRKAIALALRETRAERLRQREESKKLTGAKRMETTGQAELI